VFFEEMNRSGSTLSQELSSKFKIRTDVPRNYQRLRIFRYFEVMFNSSRKNNNRKKNYSSVRSQSLLKGFKNFKMLLAFALSIVIVTLMVPHAYQNASGPIGIKYFKVASVQSLKQQAAQIASQIASENNQLDQLDQQYLTAQQNLSNIEQQISATQSKISSLMNSETALRSQIRQEALSAYIEAESGQGLSSVLSSNATTLGFKETYLESATGNLNASVANLEDVQNQLSSEETSLNQQKSTATQQLNQINQAKAQATQLQAQLTNTENSLNGQIATLVAQQQAAARAAAAQAAAAKFKQEQAMQAEALAAQAANSLRNSRFSANLPTVSGSGAGAVAVQAALSYIGVWYQWGGTSRNGVDCSGLTMLAWEAAGVQLPRTAQEQYYATAQVSLSNPSQWQPGDLVFYGNGTSDIYHVAMYIGNGEVVEALETGTQVQVDSIFYAGTPVAIGQP
jgi:cell wall-associated NlpC family hydrolase